MDIVQTRVVSAALFFLFIFLSGFWLAFTGKPLNTVIFTGHKLITIAALVFLFRMVSQINRVAHLSTVELIAVAVVGVLFLLTIASGGALSIGKPMPAIVLIAHRVAPFLTLAATIVAMYLLLNRTV